MMLGLCTNDERGNDTGRVSAVSINHALELQWCYIGTGPRYSIKNSYLHISRRRFPIRSRTEWYGNWCWTGVSMTPEHVAALLNYLSSDDRWQLDGGWCDLTDLYEEGKVTPEMLEELDA